MRKAPLNRSRRPAPNLASSSAPPATSRPPTSSHSRARAGERVLPPDHPDVALSLNNLALLRQERREFDQALALQQRALAILEPALGPEHATVATAINNLALTHQ